MDFITKTLIPGLIHAATIFYVVWTLLTGFGNMP